MTAPDTHRPFHGTDLSAADFNRRGAGCLPGHLGIVVESVAPAEVHMSLPVTPHLLAPNGFLHAGALVTLADTAAGYGCVANLPAGANGFTTIELKSNHLATTLDGHADCTARPAHVGRTTQVWDATVTHRESGRTLALFRCTQMVLYPKG
ncbi:MAG: PaaI family thioesterase [Rubrivivax sp.]|jgi:1,4-dihydroxy-2-naphthoyl-CoA hydrolase